LQYQFEVVDCASFLAQFQEIFVNQMYSFRAETKTPVIVDCGANIGMSCAYFKELFPESKVVAFEADPTIAKVLANNIKINDIRGVEIVEKAVWVDDNGVDFSSDGADGGAIHGPGKSIKVPSVRLRQRIEEIDGTIDMLKIDVEGAETDVLIDSQQALDRVRHIFVEFHAWRDRPQRLDELLQVLRVANFRYYIQPIGNRRSPFVNRGIGNMDVQLNVFAYR
jgi:FkbM family methyltransferase